MCAMRSAKLRTDSTKTASTSAFTRGAGAPADMGAAGGDAGRRSGGEAGVMRRSEMK
jgi:hypothetical protein